MFEPVFAFMERFGNVVGRFLLTIVYFVALAPVAIVYRSVCDVLMTKSAPTTTFRDWESINDTLEDARRQD